MSSNWENLSVRWCNRWVCQYQTKTYSRVLMNPIQIVGPLVGIFLFRSCISCFLVFDWWSLDREYRSQRWRGCWQTIWVFRQISSLSAAHQWQWLQIWMAHPLQPGLWFPKNQISIDFAYAEISVYREDTGRRYHYWRQRKVGLCFWEFTRQVWWVLQFHKVMAIVSRWWRCDISMRGVWGVLWFVIPDSWWREWLLKLPLMPMPESSQLYFDLVLHHRHICEWKHGFGMIDC